MFTFTRDISFLFFSRTVDYQENIVIPAEFSSLPVDTVGASGNIQSAFLYLSHPEELKKKYEKCVYANCGK
jgi:hypothetical protein